MLCHGHMGMVMDVDKQIKLMNEHDTFSCHIRWQ